MTIVGNHAGWTGGGIVSDATNVTVRASIIASNTADNGGNPWRIGYNCTGTLPNGGFNMEWLTPGGSTDYSCGFTTANPKLGAFTDAGTSWATLPPQTGSPAIDRVTSGCPPPSTDQRGTSRPQSATCDAGAHEAVSDVWVRLAQSGGAARQGVPFSYT